MEKTLAPIPGNRPRPRSRKLAPEPTLTKLYRDDWHELKRVAQKEDRKRADVLREMARIGFRVRRLKATGTDATMPAVKAAQRDVVEGLLAPIVEALQVNAEMRKRQGERLEALGDALALVLENQRRLLRDSLRTRDILWEAVTIPRLLRENEDLSDADLTAYRERDDETWNLAAHDELERARETVRATYRPDTAR